MGLSQFEEFWLENGELFSDKLDIQTAELIWNSAVTSTTHNLISKYLSGEMDSLLRG